MAAFPDFFSQNSWPSKESHLKDDIANSVNYRLMDKILGQHDKDSCYNNKMVYYQATSLITKSKYISRGSFCDSISENYDISSNINYNNNNYHINMQRQSVSTANNGITATRAIATATPTITSSINHHLQQRNEFFNIKNASMQQQQQLQQQQQQEEQHQLQEMQLQQRNIAPYYATSEQSQQQQEQQHPYLLQSTTPQQQQSQQQQDVVCNSYMENMKKGTLFNNKSQLPISHQLSNTSKNGRKINVTGTCNKSQFKCDYCGMTFGSKSAHTSHTKSHTKNGELGIISTSKVPNIMEINELTTSGGLIDITKQPQLKVNLNAVNTGSDPYQCNVCQKTFAVPARLIRHYRTHTGERPFECEFCHKLFSVKENLQVHRRIHTKERPYKCEVCGRAFEHSGKLHRHMRIHTGERPHKCETCGKTFIQSGQLVIHIRTHTGEKPYKCPVQDCKKDFTCSKQLKVHSRIHTGEKPYQCEFCKKCFGYNHVLKLHRRSHLATKCFQCNICEVTLVSKKAIEAHIKGHANAIPHNDEDNDNGNGNGNVGVGVDVDGVNAVSSTSNVNTTKMSTVVKPHSSSSSTSSGIESISSPNSPQSFIQKTKTDTVHSENVSRRSKSPLSPSSTTASISSNSSYHSTSPHAIDSLHLDGNQYNPERQIAYQQASQIVNASGIANGTGTMTTLWELKNPINYHTTVAPFEEEMPKDLRVTPITSSTNENIGPLFDYPTGTFHDHNMQYHYMNPSTALQQNHFITQSLTQAQLNTNRSPIISSSTNVGPIINPALLEASCIAAGRRDHQQNDDVEQAAIQIMQLHHNQRKTQYCCDATSTPLTSTAILAKTPPPTAIITSKEALSPNLISMSSANSTATTKTITPINAASFLDNINTTYDYAEGPKNAQDILLQSFKTTEFIKQPALTKGSAPVPKFQSSLHDNDIILRQVEAAIAPLRLSSDSPERSSSPEDSDTDRFLMMADRDVMTLPLRKRKLYMSEKQPEESDTVKTKDTISASATTKQPKVAIMTESDQITGSVATIADTAAVKATDTDTDTDIEAASESMPSATVATRNVTNLNLNRKVVRQNSVIQFAKAS